MTNGPILDLTVYHRRHTHGDITVYLTWLRDRQQTACLVLVPPHRMGRSGLVPCVVPITRSWVWSEEIGDGRQAARTCMEFAEALGLNPANRLAVYRVASIIRDHIGDLVLMPVKPTEARVVADAVMVDPDGRSSEAEIIEHV